MRVGFRVAWVIVLAGLQVSCSLFGSAAYRELDEIERAVFHQVNFARTDPQGYAEQVLIPMRPYYQGKLIVAPPWYQERPDRVQKVATTEGAAALEEAIAYMLSAQPIGPLTVVSGLNRAAELHQREQQASGQIGHLGQAGSTAAERIAMFGLTDALIGENLFYGNGEQWIGELIVMALLIDDGVPDRGHRRELMEPKYRLIGLAYGPHPVFGAMCVQSFAVEFTEHEKPRTVAGLVSAR
ncbi:CAP domain-containing protein [Ferrimonas marina]|uniref:Uncharacterized conserved protein YkwD, contains CAP (CSP/antigen 5/PR1) domain n=1 Tax=Ferrimonas marina TaxID=299255 RepID=A0A1M5P397_9GAMM|nr:CAP domain-containing protein [Ferrimonas marina]SHG96296.1 Uncharacterized conserved protein YkwD, contains CAP (CSP/antigen 5/PR1) domain [Ferrimonas marina]